jgi:hypothetical protein
VEWQLQYHEDYTKRPIVHHAYLKPLWQLLNPGDHLDHLFEPGTSFVPLIVSDWVLFALAIPGVVVLLRRKSVYGLWLVLGLAFLMVWPSQWVQHKMVIMVPYSLAAAAGLDAMVRAARKRRRDRLANGGHVA